MLPLPPDLLDLPAETGARRVALHFLAEAEDAFPRLDRAEDAEALHDFRVGLRRLRSALRSYEPQLHGALGKRLRRRLRRLARATGASRDAEVHAAWLAEQQPSLAPGERAGAAFFADRLASARRAADDDLADEVLERFPKLSRRVSRSLRRYERTVDVEALDEGPTFASTSAELLRDLAATLEGSLAAVRGIEDQELAHEARIAGKRLRYALEPLVGLVDGVAPLVKQLKRLQDALGELHDAHVFAAEVEALAASTRSDESSPGTSLGLDALAARLRARRETSYAESGRWLSGDDGRSLLAGVRAVADTLGARRAPGVEIERKYLLRALPDQARGAPVKEIDQGYLPGERLVERVRRVRTDGAERFYRTMKLGGGVQRIEVEEPTTPELFEALWALTAGRRVRKRRHLVQDGALTWEIDDFADRELVLAEVELPDAGAAEQVAIPDWLAPFVVRDVTDEPEYVNARLAR
jgi:CHAD domain-containing protein/CYTH domain-containing protein